ncbi:MFS transporter [Jiangella rhizosphaerae]|uniref:MFS transporter n=1 Tax=Jiangella rhizosphaerae TaxID=2293569 RepID=A0A418KUM2_9ACTN|nr:MFS transporter [Jiangella rhizosphaerae]RIQ31035.1 MFS transporter [Jiangella rhizosphaerae]
MSTSRRAWTIWAVGVSAYIVAVMHRTTFGVAGLDAAGRFDVSASVLASFVVLQLVVYAGLQIPIGLLLDRVGGRRLVVAGALLMAAGQAVLAFAESVPPAAAGRVLVGMGDALTFVSVLRLVSAWFPPGRVPVMTQLTGLVGQAGQVLSAVPFVAVLHAYGWSAAFGSAAATGVLVCVLAAAALRDSPSVRAQPLADGSMRHLGADLVTAWRHPGTRLGLWTHFTTQFSGTVFALMWGFPFLVSAEGLSEAAAGALLTLTVVAGVVAGPIIGVMVQRHPLRRSWLVLGIVFANAAAWTAVLLLPGRAPGWLLVLLVLSMALSGPGSMIGFDFARTFNPPNRLGTATGIVNVGGFLASLLTILAVGLVLDARSGGASSTQYDLGDFRVAMCVQYVMWTIGLVGILRSRRLARRRMAESGVVVPPIRDVIAARRRRRRGR